MQPIRTWRATKLVKVTRGGRGGAGMVKVGARKKTTGTDSPAQESSAPLHPCRRLRCPRDRRHWTRTVSSQRIVDYATMTSLPEHRSVPGAPFAVDEFRFRSPTITAFFLTHAHRRVAARIGVAGAQQQLVSRAPRLSPAQRPLRGSHGALVAWPHILLRSHRARGPRARRRRGGVAPASADARGRRCGRW